MADLPPLPAIRVFEAVARHGNLTRAAAELNMTQSAVSYQVKLLEQHVGGPLFLRRARGVDLTQRGRQIDPVVRQALADLTRSFRQAREAAGHVLAISTMQTIAGNWLAPRIGRFQLAHPELAVRIEISPRFTDFAGDGIDVAIRSGRGDWPGLACHRLFDQVFTPVASPAYLAREGRPDSPAALLDHVLIDPTDDWWGIWFRAAGVVVAAEDRQAQRGGGHPADGGERRHGGPWRGPGDAALRGRLPGDRQACTALRHHRAGREQLLPRLSAKRTGTCAR